MDETRKVETRAKALKPLRKFGKMLVGSVLAAGIMLAASKPSRASSVELMAGNERSTLDLKASAPVNDKLGVFMRARPSVDYKGVISSYGLADLVLNLSNGLDAISEVRAFGGNVVPRAGMRYSAKTENVSLCTVATIGLDSKPYFESLTLLGYFPTIYKTLKLFAQVENISDVSATGHDSSKQRIRLGVEQGGWGAGAAVDLTETGNSPTIANGTFDWNAGGYVSRKF